MRISWRNRSGERGCGEDQADPSASAAILLSSPLRPEKDLTRLLLAYSQYKAKRGERGWKLVILGDGPLRGKLLRQRSRLHLESDVIFPGFVQYDQLPLYYGLAGAFVHASIVEQWGLVVNEALAAALPVLVSNRCGCVPELVHDGENGFLFDPLNIGELSRLLDLVSRTPDLQKMGRRSRSIIQGWSPAKFAEGMLQAATTALTVGPLHPRLVDRLLVKALALT